MDAVAVQSKVLTEKQFEIIKSIASLNYSRRAFHEYASEYFGLSIHTVGGHLLRARKGLRVTDTPSLIICLVSGEALSLDELVAEKEDELKGAFAELRPYEKRFLQEMYQRALETGAVCSKILAPQLHISTQNLKNKISATYLKLRPLCVTNCCQLSTVACAYVAWYGDGVIAKPKQPESF
ncbi:MAG: hypothetical protein V1702_01430 [Candidatus Woesearchaeota archaeon]